MALEFPLSSSDFMDKLRVPEVQFYLVRQNTATGLGGGEILTAERAPPYWAGSVSLAPMPKRTAAEVQALLTWLEDVQGSFHVHKPNQIGPAFDILGTGLASAAPVIEFVSGTDKRKLKVGGLPSGYEIGPGDFLAFDYDPGTGTRRALHQVVSGRVADTASAYSDFTQPGYLHIAPYIRPGYALGAPVSLVRPDCIAVLVPGSVSYGITSGNVTSGISFKFRQKLRA